MRIERVEVRTVAPDVKRYTWSYDLPDQYATNTIVRIFTDEGTEGVGGVWNATAFDYDRYTAETLRHMIPILVGKDPLLRESLWHELRPRVFPQTPAALAALDIALWDLAGKAAGMPLYKLLGGARDRVQSYASTPMLEDVPTYLKLVEELIEQGFKAIKFHCWCLPDRDLELARAVRQRYPGDDLSFMLDAENNYDRAGALRVAEELTHLGFEWLEAPFPDYDLEGYRELTAQVGIRILPSGNWFQVIPTLSEALRSGAWSAARTDVTMCGGYTPARKVMGLAESMGMNCEVMCWGNSLISVANLHLILAFNNCKYYEQPLPYEPYEYGMKDVIRTQQDGYVYAPESPGLGLQVDWEAMEAATIHSISTDAVGQGA